MKTLEDLMKTPREDLKQPARRPKAIVFTSPLLYKQLMQPLLNQHGVLAKLWTEEENQGEFSSCSTLSDPFSHCIILLSISSL